MTCDPTAEKPATDLGSSRDTTGAVTQASLNALRVWPREAGEEAPSSAAIIKAMRWVAELRATVAPASWQEPAVTASESGEVVLEWWKRGRRVTVYILEGVTEVIRSWGPSVNADMDVVACDEPDTLVCLLEAMESADAAAKEAPR